MNLYGMITTKVSWEYTSYSLKSFFRKTKLGESDRMILIDNDGSFEEDASWFSPQLEIMKNRAPSSTGVNFNQLMSLAAAGGYDLYILHNDIIFTDGWQEPLSAISDAIVAAASNQYFQYETKGMIWGPSLKLNAYLGKEALLREAVKLHKEQPKEHTQALTTPFFCVRIPRAVYAEAGKLDENLEAGSTLEADYTLRARSMGFGVFLAEQSYVLHFSDGSMAAESSAGDDSHINEQAARATFEQRWGRNLSRIVIDGDYSAVDASPELATLREQKNYQSLFEKLKP